MLIHLPDAVALKYQQAATQARIPLEKLLERQLARFADTPVTQRVLALTGEPLEAIERTLGLGSIVSAESLLASVRLWAGITIGNIRVDFSPAQLDEIAYRAEKQGKTPQAIVEDIVAQMSVEFFHSPVVAR